jgi:hypothetical protein
MTQSLECLLKEEGHEINSAEIRVKGNGACDKELRIVNAEKFLVWPENNKGSKEKLKLGRLNKKKKKNSRKRWKHRWSVVLKN